MARKLRRSAARAGLVVGLVLLALMPVLYPYLSSVLAPGFSLPRAMVGLDFSLALDIPVWPSVLLDYSDVAMRSVQEGNYTEAGRILGMMGRLPANVEHTLRTYLTLAQELVSTLNSSRIGLEELRGLIDDGALIPARQKIPVIENLLANASNRLDLLFSSLDRIRVVYVSRLCLMCISPDYLSRQRQDVRALLGILRGFEQALAELKSLLEAVDLRAETQLFLLASPNPVWVEETIQVWGQLGSGSELLSGRSVDLWIKADELTKVLLVLDDYGSFRWEYHVSSTGRLYKVELYGRYKPSGLDAEWYRPARSETISVTVRYRPVSLTLTTSASRLHVLEQFTAQGRLTDASGYALAYETVELVINGVSMSARTDSDGAYSIAALFPSETIEGMHQLYAYFDPKQGIHASATSEKRTIQIYYVRPMLALVGGELFALSGQAVQVNGRLMTGQTPLCGGSVIAVLGQQELGRAVSGADGVFNMTVYVPLDATGDSPLRVIFVPDRAWITGASGSIVLRVLNSLVVGLGVGAVVFVGAAISGTTFKPRRAKESLAVQVGIEAATALVEKPEGEKDAPLASVTLCLGRLREIQDPRVCVTETYWETRRVLGEVLQDRGRISETHREYEARAVTRLSAGASSAFSALTKLFELAEYSLHPFSSLEAEEGISQAVAVTEALNVKAKP